MNIYLNMIQCIIYFFQESEYDNSVILRTSQLSMDEFEWFLWAKQKEKRA